MKKIIAMFEVSDEWDTTLIDPMNVIEEVLGEMVAGELLTAEWVD